MKNSWEIYRKIKKLTEGGNTEDRKLGAQLLLIHADKLTPKQFRYLNSNPNLYYLDLISLYELQQCIYDKRKQEKEKSLRKNKKISE